MFNLIVGIKVFEIVCDVTSTAAQPAAANTAFITADGVFQ